MFNTPCTVCSFFRVERYTTELKFDSIYENDITFCIVTSLNPFGQNCDSYYAELILLPLQLKKTMKST